MKCKYTKQNGLRCDDPDVGDTGYCYFHTKLLKYFDIVELKEEINGQQWLNEYTKNFLLRPLREINIFFLKKNLSRELKSSNLSESQQRDILSNNPSFYNQHLFSLKDKKLSIGSVDYETSSQIESFIKKRVSLAVKNIVLTVVSLLEHTWDLLPYVSSAEILEIGDDAVCREFAKIDIEKEINKTLRPALQKYIIPTTELEKLAVDLGQTHTDDEVKAGLRGLLQEVLQKVGTIESKALAQQLSDLDKLSDENKITLAIAMAIYHSSTDGGTFFEVISELCKNEKDISRLHDVLGANGRRAFKKLLMKAIMREAETKYRVSIALAGDKFMPDLVEVAQKAVSDVVKLYDKVIFKSLISFSEDEDRFLNDLNNIVYNCKIFTGVVGIDISGLTGVKGQVSMVNDLTEAGIKAASDNLAVVKDSPVWKNIISGRTEDLRGAIISSKPLELNALKEIMGEESSEWKIIKQFERY